MNLVSRKEFDRKVTGSDADVIQAVLVKEGYCLICGSSQNDTAFMLKRTDGPPYIWRTASGPIDYAASRGKPIITTYIQDHKSVNNLLSEGLTRV